MRLRTTLVLVLAAIAVAVVAYINPFKSPAEFRELKPWFYQIAWEDIESIKVNLRGQEGSFVKVDPSAWAFTDPEGIPPSNDRWSGIQYLLSGPKTQRDLTSTSIIIEDLAQYGLDDPATVVDIGLTQGRSLEFRLGDVTPNGFEHYGQVIGFPQLFLIADAWGDVLGRLVTEPPLPKWYIKRDPVSIVELNLSLEGSPDEAPAVLQFKQEDDIWSVDSRSEGAEPIPVDPDRWAQFMPLLSGPTEIKVAVPFLADRDYSPYGITEDSRAIELRFSWISEKGTRFVDGVLFTLGDKAEDDRWYYGRAEGSDIWKPVLLVDAQWADKLFGLFDDIPYGQVSEPQASADSG